MKKAQSGFTLIELVMVIVILGILAAVALPRFVDLSSDARTAAIQGAAGALSSFSAINYGTAMARGAASAPVRLSAGSAAAALTASVMGWDATKFVIWTDTTCGTVGGAVVSATLSHSGGTTANSAVATMICTG